MIVYPVPAPFVKLTEGIPVKHIYDALVKHPDLWNIHTERAEYPGSAHHSTDCIFVRGPHEMVIDKYQQLGPVIAYDLPMEVSISLNIIGEVLSTLPIKELGYILITSLYPGCSIDEHIDEGEYASYYNRLHIPIHSKPGNVFKCDGEEVEMKEGELWMFDHTKLHSFTNNSNEERIHIIMDVRFL